MKPVTLSLLTADSHQHLLEMYHRKVLQQEEGAPGGKKCSKLGHTSHERGGKSELKTQAIK